MTAVTPWQRVIVRHLLAERRKDVDRLYKLVKPTFEATFSGAGGDGLRFYCQPRGRWLLGVGFRRQDWVTLFSNAATTQELFARNADSKRLEVAWTGFDPQHGGWFFWLNQGGKPLVRFSQATDPDAQRHLESNAEIEQLLAGCPDGQSAWKALCQQFGVPEKSPAIIAQGNQFVMLGVAGKPVKTSTRGAFAFIGPEMAEGENKASDQLVEAIDKRDVNALRAALEAGASPDVRPGSSLTPLVSVLLNWDRPWAQPMAKLLMEFGASVNGRVSPVLEMMSHLVSDSVSHGTIEFLIEHGAKVDLKDVAGRSILFDGVVYKKRKTVKLLLEHAVTPDKATIDWLRQRIERDFEYEKNSDYIEYLTLLTGETVALPEVEALSAELQAENRRFAQCIEALGILKRMERGLPEAQARLNLLASPPSLIDGQPPRYEKLKCYIDFSRNKDPGWSTARIVADCQEDLAESLGVDPKEDDWAVERGIQAAYQLAVARHMQFAGAPESTDFLATGGQAALKLFAYQASRSKPFHEVWLVDQWEQSLLLAVLAADWELLGQLCETLRAGFANARFRMPDYPTEEAAQFWLVVASHFRAKKLPGVSKLADEVRASRKKRYPFLLEAWDAIESPSQAAFQKAL